MDSVIKTDDRAPDYVGTLGKAWRLDVPAIARRRPGGPPPELTVSAWIVHAPYAHPCWHSYLICGISLRAVPSMPHAKINLAGATHEAIVLALNPDHPTVINDNPRLLSPANFVGQFIEGSDAAAAERVDQAVRDVCDGKLNPDTDYIRWWVHRFSDSNLLHKERAGETRIVVSSPGGEVVSELVIPPVPGPQDMH